MRHVAISLPILGLGLLAATTVLAAGDPIGTGNYRRKEALAVAKAQQGHVYGISGGQAGLANPTHSRILFVEAFTGRGFKITLVKAPLDKRKRVTRLSRREANQIGLLTQAQAKALASKNGGLLGSQDPVKLQGDRLSHTRSSYWFAQVDPASIVIAPAGSPNRASNITRAVSVTGRGETATAYYEPMVPIHP